MADGARKVVLAPITWLAAAPWRAFLLIFLLHMGVQAYFLRRTPAYLLPQAPMEVPACVGAL